MGSEVFVFGAGASYAAAGLPLGSNLIWSYDADRGMFRPMIGGTARTDRQDKELYPRFLEFLTLAGEVFPELAENVTVSSSVVSGPMTLVHGCLNGTTPMKCSRC